MLKNNHEINKTEVGELHLLPAESLTESQIDETMPHYARQTWGELEKGIATNDVDRVDSAIALFEGDLDRVESGISADTAEKAAVVALRSLYRARVTGDKLEDSTFAETADQIDDLVDLLGESPRDKDRTYAFELAVLAELVRHRKEAFLASPREEASSNTPEVNHDVYVLDGNKTPISVKYGAKKTTRYSDAIRSVSRKHWKKLNMDFWSYIKRQVPEISDSDSQTK